MVSMKVRGRASLLLILCVAAALLVVGVLLFSKEGVTTSATRFMSALAQGDVKTLSDNSFMDGVSKEDLTKRWEKTVKVGEHYMFRWHILSEAQSDDNNASVRVAVMRNANSESSYDENFGLALVKKDGKWLIDVKQLSRQMYPGLPR